MSTCSSQPAAGSTCRSTAPIGGGAVASIDLPPGASPIRLTDAVIGKVGEMLAEEGDPQLRLRIFVTGGGCSGFQYGFAFDDQRKDDDFCLEHGAVGVLVDAMSLQYLVGAEIDYEDKLEGARFVIRNPNAASTCGCGSSFSL